MIFGIYYIASAIIGFIIGMYIFKWLNQKFDVYYFGFMGVISTFGVCWAIGTIGTYLLGWLGIAIFIIIKIVGVFTGNGATENLQK